jgi:hypothetical protein
MPTHETQSAPIDARSHVRYLSSDDKEERMRALLLAGVLVGWAAQAVAAPMDAVYSFVGQFTSGPNPTVSGTLEINYDPSVTGSAQIYGFSTNALFGYVPVQAYRTAIGIIFGNDCSSDGSCGVQDGHAQFSSTFAVGLDGSVIPSSVAGLSYSVSGAGETYEANEFTVERALTASIPEPSALALLILPIGMAGLILTRRRRDASAV